MSKEREEFIWFLGREFPDDGRVLHLARDLMRNAPTIRRHAEALCNGDPVNGLEKRRTRAQFNILKICEELGVRAAFGGDPRGHTVKIYLPSGRYNRWDGETVGVPGS